jgi:hypothetical protein
MAVTLKTNNLIDKKKFYGSYSPDYFMMWESRLAVGAGFADFTRQDQIWADFFAYGLNFNRGTSIADSEGNTYDLVILRTNGQVASTNPATSLTNGFKLISSRNLRNCTAARTLAAGIVQVGGYTGVYCPDLTFAAAANNNHGVGDGTYLQGTHVISGFNSIIEYDRPADATASVFALLFLAKREVIGSTVTIANLIP